MLAPVPETSHLSSGFVSERNVQEVDVVTIDEFVARSNLRVTAIKIDVEGFDFDVVAGALQTLRDQTPLVLTEAKPEDRLFQLISDLDHRVFAFTRDYKISRTVFEELRSHTAAHTKMLFLVPGRLASEFSKRAAVPFSAIPLKLDVGRGAKGSSQSLTCVCTEEIEDEGRRRGRERAEW